MQSNKVCIPAPHKLSVGRDVLEEAGCELVLGKDQDEYPKHRYTEDELVELVGDSDAMWAAQRDVITGAVLARCPKLRAVIKAAIGYETIDVDSATELGILVCNSPARENFTGVAEAAVGLMSMLFKRLVHNQQLLREGGWKRNEHRGNLMVGLESLNPDVLRRMGKTFNMMNGGYDAAFDNLRRYGIRLYITFMLGYDGDSIDAFRRNVSFAKDKNFFMVSFNHVTPFPGTPLYEQLEREGRLLYDRWWLDPDYRYGMLPFVPTGMSPEEARLGCLGARADFYSLSSILRRGLDFKVNTRGSFAWYYFVVNFLMRREVSQREHYPLGDEAYSEPLVKVSEPIPASLARFEK